MNKAFNPIEVYWVSSPSSVAFTDLKDSDLVKLSSEPVDYLVETQVQSYYYDFNMLSYYYIHYAY